MFVNALEYSRKFSLNGGIRYLSNIMDNDFNSAATTACKVFSPNAGKYGPEKKSVFGHFSRGVRVKSFFVFEKIADSRTTYFLILGSLSDLEPNICDQMRKILIFQVVF